MYVIMVGWSEYCSSSKSSDSGCNLKKILKQIVWGKTEKNAQLFLTKLLKNWINIIINFVFDIRGANF